MSIIQKLISGVIHIQENFEYDYMQTWQNDHKAISLGKPKRVFSPKILACFTIPRLQKHQIKKSLGKGVKHLSGTENLLFSTCIKELVLTFEAGLTRISHAVKETLRPRSLIHTDLKIPNEFVSKLNISILQTTKGFSQENTLLSQQFTQVGVPCVFLKIFMYFIVVDWQHSVNFCCTAK